MIRTIVMFFFVSFLAVGAQAEKKGMVDSEKGYGLAGCGLGSLMFGAKPGGVQIVAATTNGTSGNQTFGITFGTLNCDIKEMGTSAAIFIESNREVVAKEAARGQGETLAGLAQILKCNDQAAFNQSVQKNYEKIFAESSNAYNNVHRLYETIQGDAKLKTSCNLEV